jgi:hypothetical protein|tara:strand:+ start:1306 stop:1587 length:282 start_codon:yes stop_codon:yes gene_type:complete
MSDAYKVSNTWSMSETRVWFEIGSTQTPAQMPIRVVKGSNETLVDTALRAAYICTILNYGAQVEQCLVQREAKLDEAIQFITTRESPALADSE